jgi:hypothetical protein
MKKIWLRNARKYAFVDNSDYDLVKDYHWWMHHTGYAVTRIWVGLNRRKHLAMHRLIMGEPKGFEVDHRDQKPTK